MALAAFSRFAIREGGGAESLECAGAVDGGRRLLEFVVNGGRRDPRTGCDEEAMVECEAVGRLDAVMVRVRSCSGLREELLSSSSSKPASTVLSIS